MPFKWHLDNSLILHHHTVVLLQVSTHHDSMFRLELQRKRLLNDLNSHKYSGLATEFIVFESEIVD